MPLLSYYYPTIIKLSTNDYALVILLLSDYHQIFIPLFSHFTTILITLNYHFCPLWIAGCGKCQTGIPGLRSWAEKPWTVSYVETHLPNDELI